MYIIIIILCFASIVNLGYAHQRFYAEKLQKNILTLRQQKDWEGIINKFDEKNILYYSLGPSTMPTIWYRGVAYFSKGKFELALNEIGCFILNVEVH